MGATLLTMKCLCCSGVGEVEASTGKMRPCSRCRGDDFRRWYVQLRDQEDAKLRAGKAGAA